MRTLLFGATLVTAFLLPVTPASAQCCGSAAQAVDHSAHVAPATPATPATPAAGCCDQHQMAAPATPATPAAGCCAKHEMAAPAPAAPPMACCNHHAPALPADDPAVAMAGFGLADPMAMTFVEVELPSKGEPASRGVPIR